MPDDAARFRQQAKEAREHAERVISPLDKEEWLRLAGEWLKLAQDVESRRLKFIRRRGGRGHILNCRCGNFGKPYRSLTIGCLV